MIIIDKLNKSYEDIMFYIKGSDSITILNEGLQKYVKDAKTNDILTLTDIVGAKVKKINVICLDKNITIKSLSKLFAKFIKSNKGNFNILVDTISKLDKELVVKQLVLDYLYYSYNFDRFKSTKKEESNYILVSKTDYTSVFNEASILGDAIDTTRNLVNTPVNYLNTYELCDFVTDLVSKLDNTTLEILDEKQCEELKMGAFLGVNAGSLQKARLITIKYQGLETYDNPIGLVGKGVMFDTGGYSIKLNMNTMKCDMAGSATVIGVLQAAAMLNLKVNLMVVIAATDNRINEHAIVVDDILTAMNGKTIEIGSTDAEGRLTLADALTYIQSKGCREVIDMATLTGAVVAALGDYITGVFSNDKKMVNKLIECAKAEDEIYWELPITDHIRDAVRKSSVADLKNRVAPAAASAAAAFLEEFIEDGTKWVHMDIAGTSYLTSPSYLEPVGATGVGIKEVINYLKTK